ncbi:MAG: cation diffusion facilitator family transporter [Cyclobacteriaceae bacterium]
MGHHHTHDHSSDVKNIKAAFFLNLLFTIVEIIGGLYVNSMAILSDAVHDLGDSLSLGFSWYFQKLSKKGRDKTFSYGYKRFSVLGAIINSIVLVAGSLLILAETVPRLWQPVQPNAQGMLLLSILGIIINGAAVLKMKKGVSINEKVVSLHLLEDVLGWVAVLIGSIVMMFYDVPILDPLLSLLIAGFILYNVVKNLKASFKIILQANPQELNQEAIKEKVLTVPKVKSVHDLHSWTMDGNYHIMSIHIVLEKGITMGEQMEVKSKVREVMGQQAIDHVTIEVDCVEEPCELEDC